MKRLLGLGAVMLATGVGQASEQRFSSGPGRVSLLELYTSEGCSSCPPAEKWLGALRDDSRLWRDFVPVEFHVNYWDRLGWPDRFASKENTDREYAYASAWSSGNVYTPCLVLDGEESRMTSKVRRAREDSPGDLTVTVDGTGRVQVEFAAAAGFAGVRSGYDVHAALIGGGFASRVTAGENRGETLKHEFVACGLTTEKLTTSADGKYTAEFALPKTRVTGIPQQGLAVWVVRHGDVKPVQATGGWFDAK